MLTLFIENNICVIRFCVQLCMFHESISHISLLIIVAEVDEVVQQPTMEGMSSQ